MKRIWEQRENLDVEYQESKIRHQLVVTSHGNTAHDSRILTLQNVPTKLQVCWCDLRDTVCTVGTITFSGGRDRSLSPVHNSRQASSLLLKQNFSWQSGETGNLFGIQIMGHLIHVEFQIWIISTNSLEINLERTKKAHSGRT